MSAVTLMPVARQQFFDDNGVPLAGGRLYTYVGGTSTPKATYTDATGQTEHTNPIVLDSSGRATVYFSTGAYKLIVMDADNVTLWSEDGVVAGADVTDVDTVTDLRALLPGSASTVRTLGRLSKNDGGGWSYYWDADSTAADNGGTIIRPSSLPVAGRWLGFKPTDDVIPLRLFGAAMDGVTDDVSILQTCDTYCSANGYTIYVDGDVHLATDPELESPVRLKKGVLLSWGDFSPEIILDNSINDKTRHFTCSATYAPTLVVAFLRPEWFGETASSHPVMTACLALSNTANKVMFTSIISTINTEME